MQQRPRNLSRPCNSSRNGASVPKLRCLQYVRVSAEICGYGVRAVAHKSDVSKELDVKAMFVKFGTIDILVARRHNRQPPNDATSHGGRAPERSEPLLRNKKPRCSSRRLFELRRHDARASLVHSRRTCGGGTQTVHWSDGCGDTSTTTQACNTQACAPIITTPEIITIDVHQYLHDHGFTGKGPQGAGCDITSLPANGVRNGVLHGAPPELCAIAGYGAFVDYTTGPKWTTRMCYLNADSHAVEWGDTSCDTCNSILYYVRCYAN